ncbi:glycophorin-C-like [Myxocyprinus asiaticus]|uniref:glycophorin-C-like n=1 Tax=Myxocyprinus asiaticus TaxID=70543 RepID=UPI002221B0AE|nr:glycophorin-C-like [Myxocyprinus asiaticus]XP_051549199.1 glycophorin-C-like [Myxocyprinus asiaticus]
MANFSHAPTPGPVDANSEIPIQPSNNDTLNNVTDTTEGQLIEMAPAIFESVDSILLGVSLLAVAVVLLLLLLVVLRYIAHQKGTYYTHEEALALKSDPEVQEVQNMPEEPEEEEQ